MCPNKVGKALEIRFTVSQHGCHRGLQPPFVQRQAVTDLDKDVSVLGIHRAGEDTKCVYCIAEDKVTTAAKVQIEVVYNASLCCRTRRVCLGELPLR